MELGLDTCAAASVDDELPQKLARLVDLDKLARKGPLKVWAGTGKGGVCALCFKPIDPSQSEYEIELTETAQAVRMHVDCFLSWRRSRSQPAE